MAFKIKDELDLSGFAITKFCIDSQVELPTDDGTIGTGRKVFYTGTGSNANHEYVYNGTAWKALAFLDEIADNEEFNALVGRVGTLETMLNTQDAEGVINTWNEIQTFLDSVQEGTDLMDLLNSKFDKSGGTIESTSDFPIIIDTTASNNRIRFRTSGSDKALVGYATDVGTYIYNYTSKAYIGVKDDGTPHYNNNTLLHSGNYSTEIGNYYLKTRGGTMTGKLNFADTSHSIEYHSSGYLSIRNDIAGNSIGLFDTGDISIFKSGLGWFPILHSGNIGEYNAGGIVNLGIPTTDTFADYIAKYAKGANVVINDSGAAVGHITKYESVLNVGTWAGRFGRFFFSVATNPTLCFQTGNNSGNGWGNKKTIAFTDSNVASATKLETARTIWGQSFDGTGDITGSFYLGSDNGLFLNKDQEGIYLTGEGINWHNSSNQYKTSIVRFNSSGNVTIGASDLAGTSARLYVDGGVILPNGSYIGSELPDTNKTKVSLFGLNANKMLLVGYDIRTTGATRIYGTSIEFAPNGTATKMLINSLGNVLIGTSSDDGSGAKLQVAGNATFTEYVYAKAFCTEGEYGIWKGNTYTSSLTATDLAIKGDTVKLFGDLHVTGNIIADGEVSAGGAGAEGSGSGGGASVHQEVFTPSTTTVGITHNLGTEDVIITLYEKDSSSSRWSVCLTDIEITGANSINITFGSTSSVEHKVVIMAASA